MTSQWRGNFWRPISESVGPQWEFAVAWMWWQPVECRSISGIISHMLDEAYADTDDETVKAQMRITVARQVYQQDTLHGRRCTVMYGPEMIWDNAQPPAGASKRERAAYARLNWQDEPVSVIDTWNERTLLRSLLSIGALKLLERQDCHVLRADRALLTSTQGHCGSCRYYQWQHCAAHVRDTAPDAPCGQSCCDFAPRQRGVRRSAAYVEVGPADVYMPPYTDYVHMTADDCARIGL